MPNHLTQGEWGEVLAKMKPWVGLESPPDQLRAEEQLLYPRGPLLSETDWDDLAAYFKGGARQEGHAEPKPVPITDQFTAEIIQTPFGADCMSVFVHPKTHEIWVGQAAERKVYRQMVNGKWLEGMDWGGVPSRFMADENGVLAVIMSGYLPDASGQGMLVGWRDGTRKVMARRLHRPTDLRRGDFDGSGQPGLVWAEFGNRIGQVMQWNEGRNKRLLNWPGVVSLGMADIDGDNRMELIALTGQAREGLIILKQNQSGRWTGTVQLPRHPAWGHAHLQIVDFNEDGHPDVLITNGDNGDLTKIRTRPYHGVRVCLNDGKGQFQETVFLPLPGATQAHADDFDGDGDLDIVAIAHYAEWQRDPVEAAVFFQQESRGTFTRWTLPGSNRGRWLTMAVADLDGDGDKDVVLGAMNGGPGSGTITPALRRRWGEDPVALIRLRNGKP